VKQAPRFAADARSIKLIIIREPTRLAFLIETRQDLQATRLRSGFMPHMLATISRYDEVEHSFFESLQRSTLSAKSCLPPRFVHMRGRVYALVLGSLLLVLTVVLFIRSLGGDVLSREVYQASNPPEASFFHLIVPASSAGFCRTLFSAGALNYPTPHIVNWTTDIKDHNEQHGRSHPAKLNGTLQVLQKLGHEHDHELVYVPDEVETWFQLRPEVLIQRYNAIKERLDERALSRYQKPYEHNIIFAAQKSCQAETGSWRCSMPPPIDSSGSESQQENAAKYLNSGSMMGTVHDVRKLLGHALEQIKDDKVHGEQEVFATIFGHQDYRREAINSPNAVKLPCETCQFGIGLDYLGELFVAAADREGDLDLSDSAMALSWTTSKIPQDVKDSTPPFWTPDYSGNTQLPRKKWSDLKLRTIRQSGVRPVIIHHGSGINVTDAWSKNWYAPYLRTLLSAYTQSPRIPFAVVREIDGPPHEYWGPNDGYVSLKESYTIPPSTHAFVL